MNPLDALPAEIVLRILEVASLPSIATLSRTSKAWHTFIDLTHQDPIYAAHVPEAAPGDSPNKFFSRLDVYQRPQGDITSWKHACRRYTLLHNAWAKTDLEAKSTVLQIGAHPVWRFKPDFKRRIIVSTCQAGGVNVTDMDTGDMLWSLGQDDVRPFAHLEYQDGVAVWDRFGNALEVWKTDMPGCQRGEFRQVGLLPHDTDTRGFQLAFHTLCVASSGGEAFVYDLPPSCPDLPVTLRTHLSIAEGAIGHLYQEKDVILFSMGLGGFDFHDKVSGECLGRIHPSGVNVEQVYHVEHPPTSARSDFPNIVSIIGGLGGVLATQTGLPFGPQGRRERLTPLSFGSGPLSSERRQRNLDEPMRPVPPIESDEWGAGMLHGNTMVGVSKGGRFVVCSDWRRALRSREDLAAVTAVVECEPSTERAFDLGGWLAIHETVAGKRVIFEIRDTVYLVALGQEGELDVTKPAFTFAQGIAPQLAVPVSFMGVYDDCVMTTFTTLGVEVEEADADDETDGGEEEGQQTPLHRERHFPTKAIRILSFAPEDDKPTRDLEDTHPSSVTRA